MTASLLNHPSREVQRLPDELALTQGASSLAWVERFGRRRLLSLKHYLLVKRMLDVVICLAVLPVILPLCVVITVLIRCETPGTTAIFTQYRTGRHGKRFKIYKFRTMAANAEERKLELLHLNELQWPDFKITDDPRITRIGRFLRKTSLDELPQLFNILKGDMTLVGPRPTSFAASTYRLWQTERLDVTPGLTGLRQIACSPSTAFEQRLREEITYIQNRGLLFDIVLMLLTVRSVVLAQGR
jgi:lipopolysaccharide/colanic/teichoic acid biosynthesis glycosyltransferase